MCIWDVLPLFSHNSLSYLLSLPPPPTPLLSMHPNHFEPQDKLWIDMPCTLQTHWLHSLAFKHTCLFIHALTWWLSWSLAVLFSWQQKMLDEFHPFFSEVNTLFLQFSVMLVKGCHPRQEFLGRMNKEKSGGRYRQKIEWGSSSKQRGNRG